MNTAFSPAPICLYLPKEGEKIWAILQDNFKDEIHRIPQLAKTIEQAAASLSMVCPTSNEKSLKYPDFAIPSTTVCSIFHDAMRNHLHSMPQETLTRIAQIFARTIARCGLNKHCLSPKFSANFSSFRARAEQVIFDDLCRRNLKLTNY